MGKKRSFYIHSYMHTRKTNRHNAIQIPRLILYINSCFYLASNFLILKQICFFFYQYTKRIFNQWKCSKYSSELHIHNENIHQPRWHAFFFHLLWFSFFCITMAVCIMAVWKILARYIQPFFFPPPKYQISCNSLITHAMSTRK